MTILTSAAWGKLLRSDVRARSELIDYSKITAKKITLVVIYSLYSYAFNRIGPREQTAFALLLPVMKLAAKNWINASAVGADDLKPEIIVLNVEVFHALYVIYSMQSASSASTIAVLMAIDIFALGLSLRRLNSLTKPCKAALQAHRAQRSSSRISPSLIVTQRELRNGEISNLAIAQCRLSSRGSRRTSLFEVGLYILEIDESFSENTSFNLQPGTRSLLSIAAVVPAGTARQSSAGHHFPSELTVLGQPTTAKLSAQLAAKFTTSDRKLDSSEPTTLTEKEKCFVKALSPSERRHQVESLLKLLHKTEFLLLIEYTEVMIPVVYCLYLLVMSHLPNRMYYAQFKDGDSDALQSKIANVLLYLLLELASFLLLSLVLSRKFAMSSVHQLAFVLERRWPMVQAKLLMWIMFISQSPLEHNGVDYSFQFKWLRSGQQQ